jgi:hypothetical protein
MADEIFSGTVFAPGAWASGGSDHLGAWGGGSAGATTATLTGTLTRVGDTATATIGGRTLTLRAYSDLADGVLFTTTDFTTFYAFLTVPFAPGQLYPLSYTVAGQSELACFAAGTRIATPQGARAVERLRRGDRVLARFQGAAAVRWVGRRRLAPAWPRAWPVRIAAHAFAPGRPRRDLLLSPDHAVFVGNGLIPARDLINGATITRAPHARVDYWHVELARHDLLLAEGLACESYLDTGNRRGFERPAAPRRARSWTHDACAPLLLTRAAQAPARRALLARAAALGHRLTDDPALALRAGAAPLPLHRDGAAWRAILPPGADRVTITSRSAIPAECHPSGTDPRRLGVAVVRLVLDGAEVAAADPRRAAGWHAPEPGLHWTDGAALLLCGPAAGRPRALEITLAPLLRYRLKRRAIVTAM